MANRITCNKEAIRQAYDEVRDDKNNTNWAVFKYEGNEITFCSSGEDYSEFVDQFKEEERLFGFIRIFTGDELSKRAKFAFVTWIGASVNAIKRAKVSTEKGLVKEIITNFAVEITAEDHSDLKLETIKELVVKAGGANYGTGKGAN